MKQSFDIRPWVKPALTCILGLVLIFRPGSLTTTLSAAIGLVIALAGAWKLVRFFFPADGRRRDFWPLAAAIVLLILGYSIFRNPVSLEKQVVRIIGILLVMQAVRGYVDPMAAHDQVTSTLLVIAGAVLMLMPLAVSRLVVVLWCWPLELETCWMLPGAAPAPTAAVTILLMPDENRKL